MNLELIFVVAAGGFALLHFWFVRQAEAAWIANRSLAKIGKAAGLAGLKAVRTVLQVATLVYGVLLLVLLLFGVVSKASFSADGYRHMIELLEPLRAWLSFLSKSVFGNLAFATGLVGLGYFAYREHRAALIAEVEAGIEREAARLRAELEDGSWQELPPTEEMKLISRHLVDLRQRAATATTTAEERTEIARLTGELEDRLRLADFARRMDLSSPTRHQASFLSWLWPRVAVWFTSAGLLKDSAALSKLLSRAATGILLLTLVGVGAGGLDGALAGVLNSIWDLQVKTSQAEARASWDRTRAQQPSPAPPAADDQQQAQRLSNAFLHAYAGSDAWKANATVLQHAELRGLVAREVVLAEHRDWSRSDDIAVAAASDDAGRHDHGLAELRRSIAEPAKPSPIEARLENRIKTEIVDRDGALWARLKAKLADHVRQYGEPAKPDEMVNAVLEGVLDPFAETLQGEASDELLNQARKAAAKAAKEGVQRSIEIQFDRFLAALAKPDGDLGPAMELVQRTSPAVFGVTPIEADGLRQATTAMDKRWKSSQTAQTALVRVSAPADPPKLQETVREFLAQQRLSTRPQESLNFLTEFEDDFGADADAVAKTARNRLLATMGLAPKPAQLSASVSRARNFDKLDGFRHVGGVVMGRSPDGTGSARLDLRSLRWQTERDGRLSLILGDGKGRELHLGPYLPDIVYRAALYAADGRPMVATIINTEIGAQKAILHPALLDTKVGCEMIELDSIVFRYLDPKVRSVQAHEMERVRTYDALYRIAAKSGLSHFVKQQYQSEWESEIAALIADHPGVAQAISQPELFGDPARSPLAAGYYIYHRPVLEAMKSCSAGDHASLQEFRACMARTGKDAIRSDDELDEWKAAPKTLELVSGVRDTPFGLDEELHFLRGAPANQAGDGPLTFLIQDTGEVEAERRWRFPAVSDGLNRAVSELALRDSAARAVIRDGADFAMIQRFFRLAFAGLLGERFPFDQAIALIRHARALTRDDRPTPRWDLSTAASAAATARSLREVGAELHLDGKTAMDETATEAAATLNACVTMLESAPASRRPVAATWKESCSAERWSKRAAEDCIAASRDHRESPACRRFSLARFLEQNEMRLTIAELLGVPAAIPADAERTGARSCR